MEPVKSCSLPSSSATCSNNNANNVDKKRISDVARDNLGSVTAGNTKFLNGVVKVLSNGVREIKFPNGDEYNGEVGDSQYTPNGLGIYTRSNGDVRIGYFTDGKLNGEATIHRSDSLIYFHGEFKSGKKQGLGFFRSRNEQGKGIFTYSEYEGEFQNDSFCGQGALTRTGPHGKFVDKGTFVNNKLNGIGERNRFRKNAQETYKGNFKDGLYHGQGTVVHLTLSNSDCIRYVGDFENDCFHGTGKLVITNQTNGTVTFEGEFEKGIFLEHEKDLQRWKKDELRDLRRGKSSSQGLKQVIEVQESLKKMKQMGEELFGNISREIQKSLELKLTPQEKEESLNRLVASLEGEKKPSQSKSNKGKKKEQRAKGNCNKLISAPSSQTTTITAESTVTNTPPVFNPVNNPKKKLFHCHSRVERWQEANLDAIRAFSDMSDDGLIQKYKGMSDDEIAIWRKRHHLPFVEILLEPHNENKYYWQTEKGVSMLAELVRSNKANDNEFGYVSFGIDKKTNTIFHKMFSPLKKEEYQRFFSTAEVPNRVADDEEKEWNQVRYSYEVTPEGIVEFSFPGEEHKLRIHPFNLS